MMNYIFTAMILISVIVGLLSGNISSVSESILNDGVSAVELSIYMLGGMCVWGGIMRVAEKSGLTEKLCFLFRPIAKLLFRGVDTHSRAFRLICMNITANLMGLGNAATPFGIEAMKELEKTSDRKTASPDMIVFTVLNTASITLLPTTVASLRLKHGSAEPLDVLGGILITSVASLVVSLTLAEILNFTKKDKL